MKKLITIAIAVTMLFALSSSFAKVYYNKGYFKSNGKYVGGYFKTSPNKYLFDNFSYKYSKYKY